MMSAMAITAHTMEVNTFVVLVVCAVVNDSLAGLNELSR